MTAIPHYNVVFATPGNSMLPGYVRSILKSTYFLTERGLTWNYMTEASSLVALAREKTIGGTEYGDKNMRKPASGAYTYDKIIWIDSDIAWEFEDLMRIYESDKDIMSGVYMMENGECTVYPEALKSGMMAEEIMKLRKPFVVRGVGFGFLAVKSGVFESLERPWFAQVTVEVTNDKGEVEEKTPLLGEDLSWCEKARRAGFETWVDPLVRVTHHKQIKLEWPL